MFFKLFSMKEKGFTIIELIVVIAIIALFLIIVISNFPSAKLQFTLSRVTYKFEQDLRRAQDMAFSQVEYKDSSGTVQEVSGYGVYVDIDILGNKKYIIYADKIPGNQQYDVLDYLVETIDFSSTELGIVIKEINNVSNNKVSVNFNSSDFKTTITQLDQNQSSAGVVFALETDLTRKRSVLANTSGLVEVK